MNEYYKGLIINLCDAGQTKEEIAKMLPFDRNESLKVIEELVENGIIVFGKKRSKERTKRIFLNAYYGGEKNLHEIAKEYGYSYNYVRILLLEEKIRRKRPPHNYNKTRLSDKTNDILECLKMGQNSKEIQEKYKVTRQYVSYVKNKYLGG